METMQERTQKEIALRDHLIERVLKEIPYTRLNGHKTLRLPNNTNFCFQFIEGESMPYDVGYGGNMRIQRFSLHFRIIRSFSCVVGDRIAS